MANNLKTEEKQQIEIEYWKTAPNERPEVDSLITLINKFSDGEVFLDILCKLCNPISFPEDGRILELGAGQGWASCILKKLYPDLHVTTTDISKYAIQSLHKWERVLNVKIDNAYDCRSYQTEEDDQSVDMVFCFASSHHFIKHDKTLREIYRILKPNGKAFYFYEPSCSQILHPLAYKRVNKNREEGIPEDVLIASNIKSLAEKNNLRCTVNYYPSTLKRKPIALLYYYFLSKSKLLQRILPCTANFIFTKKS